ncbi:NeuD/PglB/VioB family sugar acetyltransferase [Flavobacteriaceae bacterium KMM 6897]|nr:NeuD/PglB/VioB family sugar acetyltransferase [Flavobacteriaceae bacterium KMM 6897]MEB8345764.1 NeuD/PglB/VioB family sugar acetyltransferase [Flavobacteriaceae bacterium KMM 6898]
MQKIVIFGASGHGGVVLDSLLKEGIFECIGFLDSYKRSGSFFSGYEILGDVKALPAIIDKYEVSGIVVAIGDNWIRQCVVQKIQELVPDLEFISTVHPSAAVSREVILGKGTVVLAGVKISSNAFVGNHCILNTNSILEHDSVMLNYSSLAPLVCVGGGFHLGKCSAICIGVVCIENITVGDHSVIGAGTLVLCDIPNSVLAFGRPAKIIRKRKIGDPYLGMAHEELVVPNYML